MAGVKALVRGHIQIFRNPDPEAFIYREYEPVSYWLLVAAHFALVGIFFWMAWTVWIAG